MNKKINFKLGGGQPAMVQPTFDYKDFMYTGLVADGSQLPPVVFTSDPHVPEGTEGRHDAKIIYLPTLSSNPSADTTLRWFDIVKNYLEDNPHVIHDSGGEFTAMGVQSELVEHDVTTHKIPGAGGAFLNPCDNNFHHDMKHHYYRKERNTHATMLRSMLDAYFDVPDKNIQHYFTHCQITTRRLEKRNIVRLIIEGYRPGRHHEELHEKCRDAYLAWKKNIRILNNSVRMNCNLNVEPDDTLDGVYWHSHYNN